MSKIIQVKSNDNRVIIITNDKSNYYVMLVNYDNEWELVRFNNYLDSLGENKGRFIYEQALKLAIGEFK